VLNSDGCSKPLMRDSANAGNAQRCTMTMSPAKAGAFAFCQQLRIFMKIVLGM